MPLLLPIFGGMNEWEERALAGSQSLASITEKYYELRLRVISCNYKSPVCCRDNTSFVVVTTLYLIFASYTHIVFWGSVLW